MGGIEVLDGAIRRASTTAAVTEDEFTIRYPIPLRDAAGFNGKILANEIPVGTTGYVVSVRLRPMA